MTTVYLNGLRILVGRTICLSPLCTLHT